MIRAAALLAVDAVIEGATGLLLIAAPGVLASLLFAVGLEGAGIAMGRLAGIALLSLAVACWLGRAGRSGGTGGHGGVQPAGHAVSGDHRARGAHGVLLWPMVVIHAAMTILLARAWMATPA